MPAAGRSDHEMKPVFQKLTVAPEEGFAFKERRAASFDCPWHLHSEYELILVLESNGYRIVGDNFTQLTPNDLVFLGPGLPHIWQSQGGDGSATVHWLLIQFDQAFLGDWLVRLPALQSVRRLFERASCGLKIEGATRDHVISLMREIPLLGGLDRVVQFLRIMGALAQAPVECVPIASASFVVHGRFFDQERLDRVHRFLENNLEQPIGLAEAARHVNMSAGAFSHFFRLHTGKTFPEFLNELRISRASQMLIGSDHNITEISDLSGYNNLSNFNRQFLRVKGLSPSAYRRQMRENLGLST